MRRTIDISITVDAYDDETEQDRLKYQSKVLNKVIDYCHDNVPNFISAGCTVKDEDMKLRILNLPKKYKRNKKIPNFGGKYEGYKQELNLYN